MRVAVGSDHAGFELKSRVVHVHDLEAEGHEVMDVGASSEESADYPLYAELAARLVAGGEAEEAEIGRRHNDANVLALGGRRLDERDAAAIVRAFLAADFEGGRHGRRVDQIAAIERRSQ